MKKESENNASESINDIERRINDEFGGLVNNASNLAKSLFDLTYESINYYHDKYHDNVLSRRAENWPAEHLEETFKGIQSFFNEDNLLQKIFPGAYETRGGPEQSGASAGDISPWDNGTGTLFDCSHWPHKWGRSPFGFSSFGVPRIRHYNDCLEKNGESVWDETGRWRCLFPNAEIPNRFLERNKKFHPDTIATKEEFNEEIEAKGVKKEGAIDLGKKGIYFTKFDDFLNWKNIMYENVKKEKARYRAMHENQKKEQKELRGGFEDNKGVVSSYVSSSYNTNSDTNEVELREIKTETFGDGTSVTKKITKVKPLGASEWANVYEDVEHSNGDPIKSKGWFWNSKEN